ncbi:hypothetical protein DYH09_14585 [bacterium CPR1]|nr:hypothetical protein [bacterium CPR1]
MAIVTGLSGNEIYCMHLKGYQPGDLVIGNSVFSMGLVGSLGSAVRTLAGGEVTQVTSVIRDGRTMALERMMKEARQRGGAGITSVTSELVQHSGMIEFLSVGSTVRKQAGGQQAELEFSTSADGQELYCQLDCGFHPLRFVFGNVAYSVGIGGGLAGMLKSLVRGEVTQYSDVFNRTRRLALDRIAHEAHEAGGNAVVGIRTSIINFAGTQEMMMIGTASRHDLLPPEYDQSPVTSDLTNEEMWNLIHLGYMPIQLVLGVSVYSLGLAGGIMAAFKSLVRGEISELTTMIYDARENAVARVARDAAACGADDVVGLKTYVYQLGGGIIELMVLGTAVKKMEGIKTLNDSLPPQAIIKDKDTFFNASVLSTANNLNQGTG